MFVYPSLFIIHGWYGPIHDDEDVEVYDTNDDEGDDETDDTSEDEPRGLQCQDCGFIVYFTKLDDHEFCEGNYSELYSKYNIKYFRIWGKFSSLHSSSPAFTLSVSLAQTYRAIHIHQHRKHLIICKRCQNITDARTF